VNIINCTFRSPPIGFGFPHIGRREKREERRENIFTIYSLLFTISSFLLMGSVVDLFLPVYLKLLLDLAKPYIVVGC